MHFRRIKEISDSMTRDDVATQPRNLSVFGATSFFNDTATEMTYWILPSFLMSIGAGPAALGMIEGAAESIASFAKLFSGMWTDRLRRRKPVVVGGYLVANVAKPLLGWATSTWHVFGVRFTDRLAKGVRGVPRDVMLADSVPREKMGSAFGLLQTMDSAGAILGPVAALAIMATAYGRHFGPRAVFWLAAVPGALTVIIIAAGLRELPHERGAVAKRGFAWPRALPAGFYYVLAAVALFSIGNSSDMFLVMRAQALGVPTSHTPLIGLVFNITYTLFSWPAGKLSDRAMWGEHGGSRWRRKIVAAGMVIFALTYAAFAHGMRPGMVYVAMAFYGIYYALTAPVLKAVIVDAVPSEQRGGAFGLFDFVTSIAVLLSSVLTGLLWKHFGAAVPFALSAALAGSAALMLLRAKISDHATRHVGA
jgi:MFS family permease